MDHELEMLLEKVVELLAFLGLLGLFGWMKWLDYIAAKELRESYDNGETEDDGNGSSL